MDNPEASSTLDTQDTGRRQTDYKKKKNKKKNEEKKIKKKKKKKKKIKK